VKFNQRLYRLPVSRRRVFNAMNVAINNNFERIKSPQLERGQYKVKKINGFTKPKPEETVEFRIPDPTPGADPETTITFYQPVPGVPPIFEDPNDSETNRPGTPGTPGGSGWQQRSACLIGLVVVVQGGVIVSSAVSGETTNGRNLLSLLQSSGKAPTTNGVHNFVFEFFGWRRDKNKLPPDDPNYHGSGWVDDDNKYKIFTGGESPFYDKVDD